MMREEKKVRGPSFFEGIKILEHLFHKINRNFPLQARNNEYNFYRLVSNFQGRMKKLFYYIDLNKNEDIEGFHKISQN